MSGTGQTSPGHQRMYAAAGNTPGYHPAGPTPVAYNGVGDPQGPGVYHQPGPPDFQGGQFFPAPGSQRAGGGPAVYGAKSTGVVGRPGWTGIRYGGGPQTTTLNQLLQGPSPDGWVPEYGQTARPMVDVGGGSQPGWPQHHQQIQPQGLASPGPSPYSSRQQPPPQNTQVLKRRRFTC